MNIGDHVRLIHSKEAGIITKISSGNYVEIDIGDGFSIPALLSEIVLVSPVEAERLVKPVSAIAPQKTHSKSFEPFAENGLFLSFVPQNDREVQLYLINNTDWKILFTIYGTSGKNTTPISSGMIDGKKTQLLTSLLVKDFESWPTFETNILYFNTLRSPENQVLKHSLKCRVQSFYKHKAETPLLKKQGHLFILDEKVSKHDLNTNTLSPEKIREGLLGNSNMTEPKKVLNKVEKVIDLHIEQIQPNYKGLSNQQILEIQLKTFESSLENAIAWGVDEITFVHGVGQGKLRMEIHHKLSKHPNVAFYKDAQKEKFGYGATLAHFK